MVALLVLLAFVAFLAADLYIQHRESRAQAGAPLLQSAFGPVREPAGAFLDDGHTWVVLETSGAAAVGFDDFARGALGKVDRVEFPAKGREVRRGEPLLTVSHGNRSAELVAPLDGVVLATNERAASSLSRADRAQPSGEPGWLVRLLPRSLSTDLRRLRIAEEARSWLAQEMERLQSLLARERGELALGELRPDGGCLRRGFLGESDEATWGLFRSEFLRNPRVSSPPLSEEK